MWILTIKTSLPKVCWTDDDLKITTSVFETFEEARDNLRELLKQFAFCNNAMFDGDGHISQMNFYIADQENIEKEYIDDMREDLSWLYSPMLNALRSNLRSVFRGKDTGISLDDGRYDDGYIELCVKNGAISIGGFGDGPVNGINPYLSTNMFDMTAEKNYHLYIDDFFGGHWGQEASSELYIDLIAVKNRV